MNDKRSNLVNCKYYYCRCGVRVSTAYSANLYGLCEYTVYIAISPLRNLFMINIDHFVQHAPTQNLTANKKRARNSATRCTLTFGLQWIFAMRIFDLFSFRFSGEFAQNSINIYFQASDTEWNGGKNSAFHHLNPFRTAHHYSHQTVTSTFPVLFLLLFRENSRTSIGNDAFAFDTSLSRRSFTGNID